MTHPAVQLYVRDPNRVVVGMLTNWQELTLLQPRNSPGKWTLRLAASPDAMLLQPGYGLIIRRDHQTLMSGWRWPEYGVTAGGGQYEWIIGGWDDTIMLMDTLCWPVPGNPIDNQNAEHHVATGRVSTRIRSYFNANVVQRLQVPGAAIEADPTIGPNGTSRERFTQLLEAARLMAGRNVNFRVVQEGTTQQLRLKLTAPVDRRLAVQFAPQVGNVHGWSFTDAGPELTRAVVAGQGVGVARHFTLVTNDGGLFTEGASGAGATTPHVSALGITGNIDLRADVVPFDWNVSPSDFVIGKWTTASNQRAYSLRIDSGRIVIGWSTDGTNSLTLQSSVPVPAANGTRLAIRAVLVVNNGSGGHTATFYTAPTIDGPWTQLGTPQTAAGTTSIFNATSAPLGVSGHTGSTSNRFAGQILALQVRSGVDGTVAANPHFHGLPTGTTNFTDGAGRAWSVIGAARTYLGIVGSREVDWQHVRRIEQFRDARDTDDTDTMNDRGDGDLSEGRRRQAFMVEASDLPGQRYGTDYQIGDLVRAYPELHPGNPSQAAVDDLVEQVEVTWNEAGEQTRVWIGPVDELDEYDARRERTTAARIRQLESAI